MDEKFLVTTANKEQFGKENYEDELKLSKEQYFEAEKKRRAANNNAELNQFHKEEIGEKNTYQMQYGKRLMLSAELMTNRFKGKDRRKMTTVKTTLNKLNMMMGAEIDYTDKESFRNQLKEVAKQYDELINACNVYIEGHSHALFRSKAGKYRKKLVGQVLELAMMERSALSDLAAAERIFDLKIPGAVLGNVVGARLSVPEDIYTDDLKKEGEVLKTEAEEEGRRVTYETAEVSNTITEGAASVAGTYRLFSFLGKGSLTEKTGMVCIKERNPGVEQPHSLIGVAKYGAYHTAGDTPDRTMEELEKTYPDCQIRYSQEAGKCLSEIKVMTFILGGNIDAKKDLRFVYTKKKLDGKDFIYISGAYLSANAKLFYKNITDKNYNNGGAIQLEEFPRLDQEFKQILGNVTDEDVKFILSDIMDDDKINAVVSRLNFIKDSRQFAGSIVNMNCDKAFPALMGENARIDGYEYNGNYKSGEEELAYNKKRGILEKEMSVNLFSIENALLEMTSALKLEGYDELEKEKDNAISRAAFDEVARDRLLRKDIMKYIIKMQVVYAKSLRKCFDEKLKAIGDGKGIPQSFRDQNKDVDGDELKKRYAAFHVVKNEPSDSYNYIKRKKLMEYSQTVKLPKGLSYESESMEKYISDSIAEYCKESKMEKDERDKYLAEADEVLKLIADIKTTKDTDEAEVLEKYNDEYENDVWESLEKTYTGIDKKKAIYADRENEREKRKAERERIKLENQKQLVREELKKIDDLKKKTFSNFDKLMKLYDIKVLDGIVPAFDDLKNQKGLDRITPEFIEDVKKKFIALGVDDLNNELTQEENESILNSIAGDINYPVEKIADDYLPLIVLLQRVDRYINKLDEEVLNGLKEVQEKHDAIEKQFGNPGNVLKDELGEELYEKRQDHFRKHSIDVFIRRRAYSYGAIDIKNERIKAIEAEKKAKEAEELNKVNAYKQAFLVEYKDTQKKIYKAYHGFINKTNNTFSDEKALKKAVNELRKNLKDLVEKAKSGGYFIGDEKEKETLLSLKPFKDYFEGDGLKTEDENHQKKLDYFSDVLNHERFVRDGKETKYKDRLFTEDEVKFAEADCQLPIFQEMLNIKLNHNKNNYNKFADTNKKLEDAKKKIHAKDNNAVTELKLEDLSKDDYKKLKEENSFLANKLFTDYRARHCDELKIKRITPTEVTLPLENCAITALEEEKEGAFTTAVIRSLVKHSDSINESSHYADTQKGKKIRVYPDPRRLRLFGKNVLHQGQENHLYFKGVCGPASGAIIVNQAYGMEITDENNSVDLMFRMKNCCMDKYEELNEEGEIVIDPTTKSAKNSDTYDYSECGGTNVYKMRGYFEAFNLKPECFSSKNKEGSLSEVTNRIKQGYQVQMSVNAKLLWRDDASDLLINDEKTIADIKKEYVEDWKGGIAHSNHWINVCGVYYEEGVDEKNATPSGFIIRDTGQGVTKTVSFEQLKRAYLGDGKIFKNVVGTDVIYVKPADLSKEDLARQKEYEKKALEDRQEHPIKTLIKIVGNMGKAVSDTREFLDRKTKEFNAAIENKDEKLYNKFESDREWETLKEPMFAAFKEFDSWYEYNMDNRERFINDDKYKKLVEKKTKLRGAYRNSLLHWNKLEKNLPKNAGTYIEARRTSDKVKNWADESTEAAKDFITEIERIKDFTSVRKKMDEGFEKASLKLENFSKADFDSLQQKNPYAAGRIMNEYVLRTEKPVEKKKKDDTKSISTKSGRINPIKEKDKKEIKEEKYKGFYKVSFQKKYEYSDKVEIKGSNYYIYPNPGTFDEKESASKNLAGFYNPSAITVCTRMINSLAKKKVATVNNSLEFLNSQGMVKIEKAYETNPKTGEFVLDENGKMKELPYPDYVTSGAIDAEGMKNLFSSYNFSCNVYEASEDKMSIDTIIEKLMDGKPVAVSVPDALLEKRKDKIRGISDTEFNADTYITICGVYKKEDTDGANNTEDTNKADKITYSDIDGFFIQKPREGSVTMVTKSELREMIYGSKTGNKKVTGAMVIVGDSAMKGFDEDKKEADHE